MGKHHRLVKRTKLTREFRWQAERLKREFNEDLGEVLLEHHPMNETFKDADSRRKRGIAYPQYSVEKVLESLDSIGFYRVSTLCQVLSSELHARERRKQELIHDIVYVAGCKRLAQSAVLELSRQ